MNKQERFPHKWRLTDAEEGEAWALLEVASHELYRGACDVNLATVNTKLHELQKLVKKLERGGVAKALAK